MIIDHDPNEVPQKRSWYWRQGIYWIAWGSLAFIWIMQTKDGFDWEQLLIGFITGGIFFATVAAYTDNKITDSWRGKSPRR